MYFQAKDVVSKNLFTRNLQLVLQSKKPIQDENPMLPVRSNATLFESKIQLRPRSQSASLQNSKVGLHGIDR